MNTYLITYDLDNPGQNYSSLISKIKGYPAWAYICESSWGISAFDSAAEVRDNLVKALDQNDKLFVGKLSGEAAWFGLLSDVTGWLHENL